jgi:hypothetical protein
MQPSKSDFVLVYSTYNPGEVVLIKSILNDANIEYFTINEDGNVLYAPIGIDIMVTRNKAEEAKELLKDFIKPPKNKAE